MSDHAHSLLPTLVSWLSQEARIAVQAFLVIGGFLAAQSLAPGGVLLAARPLSLLWRRYLKLVTPYLAAVLLGIACAAIARRLMTHDSLPGLPTLPQAVEMCIRDRPCPAPRNAAATPTSSSPRILSLIHI